MDYPDSSETVRILKTYGKVEFFNELGTRMCLVTSYRGLGDYFKYYHSTTEYMMTGESPVKSSYHDLYHAMRREIEDIGNGH
jgi:hypothetical protein